MKQILIIWFAALITPLLSAGAACATNYTSAVTIGTSSAEAIEPSLGPRLFLKIGNESRTATIACNFGGTAALHSAGSYTIPPGTTRVWGPTTADHPLAGSRIDCISDTASTPVTFDTSSFPPAYYVAPNGSDSNPGTLAAPFATLQAAQNAMQNGSIKLTYVRAGTYRVTGVSSGCLGPAALNLTTADAGETWSYYPPDGIGGAIIDGGSTVDEGVCVSADNITINGLQIQNFVYNEIHSYNPNIVIENDILHDNHNATSVGLISLGGNSSGAVVQNNYLYNAQSHGIIASTCHTAGCASGLDNLAIRNNYVRSTCIAASDCGAIYIQDYQSPRSTGITVTNNYIRDTHAGQGGRGIYLDDGTSNVTAIGNIVVGSSVCFNIHGGASDVYTGNLCDEDTLSSTDILLYQNSSIAGNNGSGNSVSNNIVISGKSGAGNGYQGDASPGTPPTIANNAYHNYVGASVNSSGVFSDSNAVSEDPQLTCWAYTIATGSPVLSSPVSFGGLPASWGPPGFAIPKIGTPPSNPHSGC